MESTTRKILLTLGLVFSLVPFCVAMVGFYRFLMYIGYASPVWVILMVPALMFEALLHFGGILYAIQFWQTAQYPKSIAITSILAAVNLLWVGAGAWLFISPDTIAEFGNYEKMYENEQSLSPEGEEEDFPPGYPPEFRQQYMYGDLQSGVGPGMQPGGQSGLAPQPGGQNSGFGLEPGISSGDDLLFDDPLLPPGGSDNFSFPSPGGGTGTPSGSPLFPSPGTSLPPLSPLE